MQIFVHLLNDFSGSPRIINDKIAAYSRLGEDCYVITSGNQGFIEIARYQHRVVPYAKHPNRLRWTMRLASWYCRCFLTLLGVARRGDIVHCSTMLTAPLLLAARLKGARTVSHVMETKLKPPLFKWILRRFVSAFAEHVVYLSNYVATAEPFPKRPRTVTYPGIDERIFDAGAAHLARRPPMGRASGPLTVALICSLAWYKGCKTFLELAAQPRARAIRFLLVINGTPAEFAAQTGGKRLPPNLAVRFRVANVEELLPDIDVLISLTDRRGWVETFGLTLVEAMAFGRPVLAPNIGAPIEFVVPGRNGFLIEETDQRQILSVLETLRDNSDVYATLSDGAAQTAAEYSPAKFQQRIAREFAFLQAGSSPR